MDIRLLYSHIGLGILVGVSSMIAGAMLRRWVTNTGLRAYFQKRRLAQLLSRVRGVSAGVAADVDLHDREVVAVGGKLSRGNRQQADWPQELSRYVCELIDANQQVQTKLHQAEDQLDSLVDQIQEQASQARTDVLTGLPNRRALDERLQYCDALGHVRRLSVVMIDIDLFKQVNDVHGHDIGDQVLLEVAQLLRTQLRYCDQVYRYGGEEFAVVLPDMDAASAGQLADCLRRAIEQFELTVDRQKFSITVSLGVAQRAAHEDARESIRRADQALYAAKRAGRNCTYLHDGAMPNPLHAEPSSTAHSEAARSVGTTD